MHKVETIRATALVRLWHQDRDDTETDMTSDTVTTTTAADNARLVLLNARPAAKQLDRAIEHYLNEYAPAGWHLRSCSVSGDEVMFVWSCEEHAPTRAE